MEGKSQETWLDLESVTWPWREGLCQQWVDYSSVFFVHFPGCTASSMLRLVEQWLY